MKRFTGVMIIEVDNGNPNGDPECGGDPRVLNDGHGLISSVSIKRKIRNLFEDHTNPVTMELLPDNPGGFHIFESHFKGFDTTDAVDAIAQVSKLGEENGETAILKRFFDARVFGITGLEKVKKDKASLSIKRRGGISISDAISVAPVEVAKFDITKKAPLREDLAKKMQGDIAPEALKFVRHGLYFAKVVCDVSAAHASLMTEEDVQVFRSLMPHIFSQSNSAARPAGSVRLVHFWVKKHDKATCTFDEGNFFNEMKPSIKNPGTSSQRLSDYNIPKQEGIEDWAR